VFACGVHNSSENRKDLEISVVFMMTVGSAVQLQSKSR